DMIEWAIYSGMRRGEIFKLRHPDVRDGLIHTGSKTRKRARTVPLNVSARLGEILKRRPRRIGSDLVFYGTDGKAVPPDATNKALRRVWERAGITRPKGGLWNVFRHTWATRLAATGKVSIFEISKWMGNSVTICERHYAAYLPGSLEKSAGLLDGMATGVALTVAPTVAGE
ncbi:MAG: tyrosine-type recombinase/integrase, partial [Acidobacteria bacterium]|nr:tyrosine-type recombinase/integrase [Acidobacteriota bacterium]